ncbi:MAG: ABC transporter ATP-binding protein [Oscillospiraceae bacterium]
MQLNKPSPGFRKKLLGEMLYGIKRYLFFGTIATVMATALSYITPLIVTFTIDSVLGTKPAPSGILYRALSAAQNSNKWHTLISMALFVILTTLFCAAFAYLRGHFIALAGEGLAKHLRDKLYSHLQNVPFSYHTGSQAGDLVQRCTSDVETIRRFVQVQALEIVRTVIMVVVAFSIMLPISGKMTAIATCLLPILLVFSFIYFRSVQKQFTISDEAEGALSTTIQENLTGVRVVRAFAQEKAELDKFTQRNSAFRAATLQLNKLMGFYWGLSDTIGYLQIAITLIAGIYFSVGGKLSVGDVMLYTTYTSMLTFPMRQLGRILADLGKADISLGRLEDILAYPIEEEPGKALCPNITGEITFDNVCFDYGDNVPVLQNVSFAVKPGQTVGILGSTGSGKTSLVQLLQRLHYVKSGHITVSGVDINDIERHHLRGNIGIVLQEPFLYSRTIGENISIARPDAPAEAVHEAAKVACVHDVIEGFENGYDTVVGERGVTLSGGQKQRVAIARMLLQNTPILIFDDSLSAVDAETDVAIRNALLKRSHGTMFLISHRISTLKNADFILVLDKGELVENGTHKELCAKDGFYRRVCELQGENVPLAAPSEGGEA